MKTTGTTGRILLLLGALAAGAIPLGAQTQPFPRLAGWDLTIDTTIYTPKNLWDFIDGAAEMFLSYGFVDLTLGEYVAPDSLDVRVEAYRHASPTFAFGIYATERKPDYHFIEVGTQGYQEEGVLNFLSGEYYVKLSTHTKGECADQALPAIADGVAEYLNRPRLWPAGLRYLPEAGRQANSEGFVPRELLGHAFLGNAFTALYGEEDGYFMIFVSEYPTTSEAGDAVAKYSSIVPGATPRAGGIRFPDPYNGPVTLVQVDNLLFGLVNPPSGAVEDLYVNLIHGQTK